MTGRGSTGSTKGTVHEAARAGRRHWAAALLLVVSGSGCGGGSPLDNPATVANPEGTLGQRLSFAYFQACVQPVLNTPLANHSGGGSNTCAAAGCHDSVSGTGGALRLSGAAAMMDLGQGAEALRASAMYRNFYSAQGEVVIGAPEASLLLMKPRLQGVLHGGGLIFERADDPGARRIAYWIGRPMPQGQDEFSVAAASMFGSDGSCGPP